MSVVLSGWAQAANKQIPTGTVLKAANEIGEIVTLRIDAIEPDPEDNEKELFLYSLSILDTEKKSWASYCLPDKKGSTKAIPLSGTWDETGNFKDSKKLITFACTSGVLAKCVRWGYKPWKIVNGKSLRDYHQACAHMARADYCGNGQHHTQEGTLIDISDDLGIQKSESDEKMLFEAAWSPKGATYVRKARWYETLEELQKQCPEKLKGRVDSSENGLTVQEIRAKYPDTLLYNRSYLRKKM